MTPDELREAVADAISKAWDDEGRVTAAADAAIAIVLEQAARVAYSSATQRYIAGNVQDERGLYPPGSPYDRGRYDAAAAIRAMATASAPKP